MNTLKKWTDEKGEGYGFKCPGCAHTHHVRTVNRTSNQLPVWGFNGNEEAPTFTPSLLMRWGHYVDGTPREKCHICIRHEKAGTRSSCGICHSFIAHGRVQFLGDSTHPLRGQTVYLKPVCEAV